jgi:hypothetical protein
MSDDKIKSLFVQDVTRDIAPVVYFHERTPAKLADEVKEYIITGGYPEGHPSQRRVPNGIHEQYVHLLQAVASELGKTGGPELPNAWISGFYGSGKSSFAKLLGFALDGIELPGGKSLAETWLQRDTSPRASELREAWAALRAKVSEPVAVVFDVGGIARDGEHIHSAAVRQVQARLGYCSTEPLVAAFELKLERDGQYEDFEKRALETLRRPWSEVKDKQLAEEEFSLVMSVMFPDKYTDPMAWFTSRGGMAAKADSPEDAVAAIRDMLKFRRPSATLFLVVDEVSQYVLASKDRVDRLRAFASALGSGLKGKAWLLALGQQKLDEEADDSFLVWAKDRFPPKLRVHLAATNIRDVVHKRLLHKTPEAEARLKDAFERHRPDLKLYAYGCEQVSPDEFAEIYPMLPGYIDLLLQITTALRTRSARAQGDDQAIRGLLQLLGELFRSQKLAEMPVGSLVTLDQIYEVQHTALDSDAQASMARILSHCAHDADDASDLAVKAAKAVALLELIQDSVPTDAKLVAQCLYDRLDRGNRVSEVSEALERLKRRNLLGYSEKHGYKLQSSAGEEWERERRDIPVGREKISEIVQGGLTKLLAGPDQPKLQGRAFPWEGTFSDGRLIVDATLKSVRDEASVRVDFRYLTQDERAESTWVKRSGESTFENRLVWIAGEGEQLDHEVRELSKSQAMIRKYKPRRESLNAARKMLLQQEENEAEDREIRVREAITAAWMSGRLYFRGRAIVPHEHGASFASALQTVGTQILPQLFPHFTAIQVLPSELAQLVVAELSGPSPKFLGEELGILELDSGRYAPACSGVVPQRVEEHICAEGGLSGTALLAHFAGPPYGYTAGVVRACVAGLLRAGKVRIQPEGAAEVTAIRDVGVQDLFTKDRSFRRANFFTGGEDGVGLPVRAKICKFFEEEFKRAMDREPGPIADAVSDIFPGQARRLQSVLGRLRQLPGTARKDPAVLVKLEEALEACVRSCRQTAPTVALVKKHLDTLRDGFKVLRAYDTELTEDAIRKVRDATSMRDHQGEQLRDTDGLTAELEAALERIGEHVDRERPWQDIGAIEDDLAALRTAYGARRLELLEWQEQQAEHARAAVRSRPGFSTLSADQSHKVMRPLALAMTDTPADAIAPALRELKDPFLLRLRDAEDDANRRLDDLLSEGDEPAFRRVDLGLRNRELASKEDVDALVEEIRARLMEVFDGKVRIRLL